MYELDPAVRRGIQNTGNRFGLGSHPFRGSIIEGPFEATEVEVHNLVHGYIVPQDVGLIEQIRSIRKAWRLLLVLVARPWTDLACTQMWRLPPEIVLDWNAWRNIVPVRQLPCNVWRCSPMASALSFQARLARWNDTHFRMPLA